MPTTNKATRGEPGKCRWCGETAEPGKKHCPAHLGYYRTYGKLWRGERGIGGKRKCSKCRQLGHIARNCTTPEPKQ